MADTDRLTGRLDEVDKVLERINPILENLVKIMTEFVNKLAEGHEDDPEVRKILKDLEEDK